jgi:hypothetical protein
LTLSEIDRFDSSFQSDSKRSKAVPRIDAVAVELARPPGGDDHCAGKKHDEAKRIVCSSPFRRDSEDAHRPRFAFRSHQKPNARRVIENRDVQADRFPGQHLDHETGGSGSAAGGAAYLVVIGLIAEHAAEPILRDRQTHELQG